METTASRNHLRLILIIAAVALLAVTAVLVLVCAPYFREEPEVPTEAIIVTDPPTEPPTDPPTEPPTEAPTEEPTLPPPEDNPYTTESFYYDGRFLTLKEGDSWPGIDVSRWQYDIDWEKVAAAGAKFAMIRIGYRGIESGLLNMDPYAYQNLNGAAEAGLEIGVYFFSQALTREEAEAEAYFVMDAIADYEITMPVVFDWERSREEGSRSANMDRRTLTDCAKTFLETIEMAGYDAMIYFNPFMSRNLLYLSELKEYDFWLASYAEEMDFPYKFKMWQYTESGSIPGVDGACDFNIYFPDQSDYERTGVS